MEETYFGCEIDHIISEKRGGPTTADNLCCSCLFCNQAKGSDVGSIVPNTGQFVRFFNPRTDTWSDHFVLEADMRIRPLTDIGTVTERIRGFNSMGRLLERQSLHEEGRYPSDMALKRMRPA